MSSLSPKALKIIKIILMSYMIGYIVVGGSFYFTPERTISNMNTLGKLIAPDLFVDVHQGTARIWLSLTTGYMVMVAVMAWLAYKDPVANRICIPITAWGKATSSLTCLLYFLTQEKAFFYILNFFVDGSIVLVYLAINKHIKRALAG